MDRAGENLIIIFEDNGTGIPDEEKELIFERGFGKNTGLGLFLAREILSITGMTIRENGVYRKGARFEIQVKEGNYRFLKSLTEFSDCGNQLPVNCEVNASTDDSYLIGGQYSTPCMMHAAEINEGNSQNLLPVSLKKYTLD